MKKYTTSRFIAKAQDVHGDRYDYSESVYSGSHTKLKIICKTHGVFYQNAGDHMQGAGCLKCAVAKRRPYHQKWSTSSFIEASKKIHNDKYSYSLVNYKTYESKVKIVCPFHGEFSQQANFHLNGSGCPKCRASQGEKKIAAILRAKDIRYTKQKKFKDCKNIRELPFDFYIPDLNLLIEYDGQQHFKPVSIFGGEPAFKKVRENDSIKNKFCKDSNIKLVRISYKEDVIEKLTNYL